MNNLDLAVKSIGIALSNSSVFYAVNDPERALGLETLLPNYYIVSIDDSAISRGLRDDGYNVFSVELHRNYLNELYRNSSKLLEQQDAMDYILKNKSKTNYIQTFKISPRFEKIAKEKLGFGLLNPDAELNRKFESKISQYEFFSKYQVNFPQTVIAKLKDTDYKSLTKRLGARFVIQFNRGHTGESTYFIESKDDFDRILSLFPQRIARIGEMIDGEYYTINASVSKKGIFCAGLSYQITGVKGLTHSKGATVGNDFFYRKGIDQKTHLDILKKTKDVGLAMQREGYKGLFGIDFVVRDGQVFVIEINARQPASVSFFNKIQIRHDQIPLSLINLCEFVDILLDMDIEEYNLQNTLPVEAGQIFLRNTNLKPFLIKGDLDSGIYSFGSVYGASKKILFDEKTEKALIFLSKGYCVDSIADKEGFLVLAQLEGKRVNKGNEIARIQAVQPIVGNDGKPYDWVMQVMGLVREKLA